MLIFDAHLDLAMNALEWNRDLTQPITDIRQREEGLTDKKDRGRGTVCLPEMRRGEIGLCAATLIARYVTPGNLLPGWNSPEQAWAQTQGQLAWYRTMEERGELAQVKDAFGLKKHLQLWQNPGPEAPIGYILSLEGADSILTPRHLERAFEQGLRAVGPAHYGPGRYANGTDAIGGIGASGRELLTEMDRLGFILDATHLCDESFWEALDHFHGPVWASHNNCRELVPHNRQFTDEQINALIQRGAVIGVVLDAWMMVPDWVRGQTTPDAVGLKLERIIEHIDHICQLAGDTYHVGIGTDLDGGYGREQCPADLNTIADVQHLPWLLGAHDYKPDDVQRIMHGNFIRFLKEAWS